MSNLIRGVALATLALALGVGPARAQDGAAFELISAAEAQQAAKAEACLLYTSRCV